MGTALGKLFIDPTILPADGYGFVQLLCLTAVYGKLLFEGSNLIADGSELLLLVPSLAGVVGSVILPVLGAVPDGAMVLFSGLGTSDPAKLQKQLSVGIGALAGSTIMLLTLPWILALIAGRVTVRNGTPDYKKKLIDPSDFSLRGSGVTVLPEISFNARMMVLTLIPYVIIQTPAFAHRMDLDSKMAAICLVLCIAFFILYLVLMFRNSNAEQEQKQAARAIQVQLANGRFPFTACVSGWLESLSSTPSSTSQDTNYGTALLQSPSRDGKGAKERMFLEEVLRSFFKKYDRDNDKTLDTREMGALFRDLGENVSEADFKTMMDQADRDNNGTLDFGEFCDMMVRFVLDRSSRGRTASQGEITIKSPEPLRQIQDDEDDESDEEEYPDDIAEELTFEEKQTMVKRRSAWMMGAGTLLVLLISDPMVGVMTELGDRINVSPFYISFVLAPLASNASELIASYKYAQKKTKKTITISFSALLGAACMNNTFCLGIFMGLMVGQGLHWTFSAETTVIVVVQVVMYLIATKKVQHLVDGLVVLALYPLSLLLVALLENIAGWA